MLARFFIARPIFAWVLAICIMAAGTIAVVTLPVEQYPDIAPPTVNVTATYNGASAQTVEDSVTQVIEQQIKGIDHLLYFSSTSSSSGQARISITFDQAANPDIAQVQVQNAVNQALNRLPQEVQQQGVTVAKSQGDSLMAVALYDSTDRLDNVDISDYLISTLQDPISRINGVGEINVFGAQYAMRVWLDPHKLNAYKLMPGDVRSAIEAQNTQVTAGELGALPTGAEQALNATVTAQSRLRTAEQFRAIILATQADGSSVHLGDVARVEIGAENYQNSATLNGHPASGFSVTLSSGANAVATSDAVRAAIERLKPTFPPGMEVAYPRDSTPFVRISIKGVVHTLIEAIVLVVVVMFLFLQNGRATLIPAITVPVVLLGTFGILAAAGFTINTLTLFAMVLAIGLLVDDAIVVVENVERIMHEQHLPPREATQQSMGEITGALIGITVVLGAVFLPMAFFGGSTGIIYRQFSITIASAMALSALVALTLTPALCATLLKPVEKERQLGRFFRWFNRGVERSQQAYQRRLGTLLRQPRRWMVLYVLIVLAMAALYARMPTGFLPVEDQGQVQIQFTTPEGTPLARTEALGRRINDYFLAHEKHNITAVFMVIGRNNAGTGQNAGQAFVALRPWGERNRDNTAQAIIDRANAYFRGTADAKVSVLSPPAVRGLGQSSGFELWIRDSDGTGRAALLKAQQQVLQDAGDDPQLTAVRLNGLGDKAQLQVDIDQAQASALGLAQGDINGTLSTAWGGSYVNDFVDRGRVKRVYVQGDAPYRSLPEDIGQWYVRGKDGQMAPFASFASTHWTRGPQLQQRFNGLPAAQIQGGAAADSSSGEAMQRMQKLVAKQKGFDLQWSGLSYQEQLSSNQTLWLYTASILFIFLCLAALYESWSIPLAVLLVIPLGVLGMVVATTLVGFVNDIYFQVGLLTTIGLSAKNAILIVEFAEAEQRAGRPLLEAALEGARLRLRPIVMTSLAFVAGVLPLALSTGAGAASRREIGVSVIGGMLSGTALAVLLVPLFFVLVRRLLHGQAVHTPAG
ncbi:efflux RND transporter permease subunit [Xanthomonas translucens]|uniref:efflux RND transporter permease subunit n=2 Tax=Xanthomonas campestris pv. translucens TaxID=343 RepID=UPI0002A7858B|nr:efflux RND transporter permease subunit [Xanthomonas translucens]AVY67056.1 multidrug transporter [Xanthomonas translucens pv. undulosa]ELQ00471.1 rnd superfamily protein [Xanthomonas translucens DAR61454]MBC3971620.1 multidrug efflux RND transporter permease subunit [Xanthomonas translucens pv. undulosa]MCT8282984.1 efflux RND transporter permease subunit [Xanthomonas translucens pv. undulosa]MCT8317725.1 efflux RND transporter permease subunit [Xanthomonas translucens pv. undulosa]